MGTAGSVSRFVSTSFICGWLLGVSPLVEASSDFICNYVPLVQGVASVSLGGQAGDVL